MGKNGDPSRPPILLVVGKKRSGKTTITVALIKLLAARGFKVASVKRSSHPHELDKQGTDSWRHRAAGTTATALVTPVGATAFIDSDDEEAKMDALCRMFAGADLVVVEGGKRRPEPKVEAFLTDTHAEPLCRPPDNCLAIVTDRLAEWHAPVIPSDRIDLLADLIEREFLDPRR
jgi:molybdopterin-guanine dinucleotide biosynthesis protein B